MNEKEKDEKIKTYLGFAKNKGSLLLGYRLEDALKENKVYLLLLLPSINDKVKDDLIYKSKNCKSLVILTYSGSENIASYLGYDKLNAIGIKDINLAKAIANILKENIQ